MHSLFVTAVALAATAGGSPAITLPNGGISRAVLAPAARGAALVAVSVDQPGPDGYSCSEVTPERAVLAGSAGDQLVAVESLRESLDGLAVGGGRVATVSTRATAIDDECGEVSRLTIGAGSVAQPRTTLRVLRERVTLGGSALAVDRRGTIALAWSELRPGLRGSMRERLWLTLWPAGEEPKPPRLLGDAASDQYVGGDAFHGLHLAPRTGGGWLIASRQHRRRAEVVLDELRADGQRTTATVGRAADLTDISLAARSTGRVAVVWGAQDGGEERNEPYRVRAALREPGAARFGRARLLDAGGAAESPLGRPVVRLTAKGTALATWANRTPGGSSRVSMATALPGGSFAPARLVARRRGLAGLAVGAAGRVTTLLEDGKGGVSARTLPSGRTRPVSPRGADAYALDVAYLDGEERRALALLAVFEKGRPARAQLMRVG